MLRKFVFTLLTLLILFLGITVAYPFLRFSLYSSQEISAHSTINIIGHRGAAGLAPENTLASFQKAIDLGVDMIELDIHLTSDNELVVIHDSNVQRTTNGAGEIWDLSLQDIKKLDAGSWFHAEFQNQLVPTLEEVMDLVNGQTTLLIELKWPRSGIYPELVPALLKLLDTKNAQSWVVIHSFEPTYLQEILNLNPNINCQQLIFGESEYLPVYFDRKVRFGYFQPLPHIGSVNMYYPYLSKGLVKEYRDQNIAVGAFTLNDKNQILKAINLGVTNIITDYPNIAIPLVRK